MSDHLVVTFETRYRTSDCLGPLDAFDRADWIISERTASKKADPEGDRNLHLVVEADHKIVDLSKFCSLFVETTIMYMKSKLARSYHS